MNNSTPPADLWRRAVTRGGVDIRGVTLYTVLDDYALTTTTYAFTRKTKPLQIYPSISSVLRAYSVAKIRAPTPTGGAPAPIFVCAPLNCRVLSFIHSSLRQRRRRRRALPDKCSAADPILFRRKLMF